MREILDAVTCWLEAGESVALATVVRSSGSSLRSVGACMAATASGEMAGSISGGCVEGATLREVEQVLSEGAPRRVEYGPVDGSGWEVGLACGGTIEVYIEPLTAVHERLLASLRADETVALVTRLDGAGHLLAWPDGRRVGDEGLADALGEGTFDFDSAPSIELRPGAECARFIQIFAPPPFLTIVGAVHVAQPLVQLAQTLGYRTRVVDARRAFATRERFPAVDELVVAWPSEGLKPRCLRPRDGVVILTHDPKFDIPALECALRSRVGYIGLLGSPPTQERRREVLRERGFTSEELARIHGPVGLDLGGREPEEIALSIVAEIVAVAHNGRVQREQEG